LIVRIDCAYRLW